MLLFSLFSYYRAAFYFTGQQRAFVTSVLIDNFPLRFRYHQPHADEGERIDEEHEAHGAQNVATCSEPTDEGRSKASQAAARTEDEVLRRGTCHRRIVFGEHNTNAAHRTVYSKAQEETAPQERRLTGKEEEIEDAVERTE